MIRRLGIASAGMTATRASSRRRAVPYEPRYPKDDLPVVGAQWLGPTRGDGFRQPFLCRAGSCFATGAVARVRFLPGVTRDHAVDLDSLTCPRVGVDHEYRGGSAEPRARLALADILGCSLRPTFFDDPHGLALVKLAIADVGHSWLC